MPIKDDAFADDYRDPDAPRQPATEEEADLSIADLAETEEAKSADLAEWISGIRTARRTVIIYSRVDLMAEIDECAELESKSTGRRADHYRQRAIELTNELIESGMRFVVEARSTSWQAAHMKQLTKRKIVDPVTRTLHQIADQLVEPEGITVADLEAIEAAAPGQVAKLANAMVDVNTGSTIVNPRFVRPSSGSRTGEG